jgi:capsular exopolysaccharide synthesis family protein
MPAPHSLEAGGSPLRSLPRAAAVVAAAPVPFAPPRVAAAAEGPDWRRFLAALLHYKWLVAAIAALGAVAGAVASRFVDPQYLAQANIWIDEADRQRADRGPFQTDRIFNPEAWVDLLRSYVVLDSVVRELHLYLSFTTREPPEAIAAFGVAEEFRPGEYRLTVARSGRDYELKTADGISLERGAVGDSIGLRLGFRWAPSAALLLPGSKLAFRVSTPRDAARHLGDALDVQIDQEGNFLKIALQGADPRRITAILNAVARRYVAVAAELKRQRIVEVTRILADQSNLAHKTLTDAEQALESFQERTATLPTEHAQAPTGGGATGAGPASPDPGNTEFLAMVAQRDQMQQDRQTLQRVLATTPDSNLAVALQGVPAAERFAPLSDAIKDVTAKQESLLAMRARYTDAYPPVQRLAGDIGTLERRTIPQLVRQLQGQIDARADDAGRRIGSAASKLRAVPARSIEETRLRRSVALADNLYSTLQQRYDEAQIAEASSVPSVRVLDEAMTPQRPVRDPASRILLLGLLGGFGLAIVAAVVLDRIDPRFRYPEQVSRDLGLPILGAVPHLARGRSDADLRLEDAAAFIEALRGIRMNLVSELGGESPLVIGITSPGPGDGKSFLSANLARVFAEGGRRTLLVDADIRRGLQHRRFAIPRRPGLADYLRGETPLSVVVQRSRFPELDVVGCGTRVDDAPELLGSLMGRFLAEVRTDYDVILCDCPPLCAAVDPYLVGSATGKLVLIVRTGVSHRELTEAKLEVIGRMKIRLVGAILNDVPEGSIYGGYSYYLPGYEAVDELGKGAPKPAEVI